MSTSAVQSLTTGTPTTTVANPNANLSSSDFINMMLTELQNQDPLNPTDSQALLSQMSSIGQLQSADQLQTTLTQSNFQNQMASAGNLIGKTVTGLDASQASTTGVVTSVSAVNNQVYLNLSNNDQVSLANVSTISSGTTTATSAITSAAAATTPAATTTPTTQSTIASMLQGIVGAL
jgi:flagellar basal-body rod modification protein FlgD